jgi:hypothetical protein
VLAHSPDLAQAVLAGSKLLDAAYDEARKAKQVVDAQVAANVRRKVARSKKVAARISPSRSHKHKYCGPQAIIAQEPSARQIRRRRPLGCPQARKSFILLQF